MGQFRVQIMAISATGCDRSAQVGDKLHGRCKKFSCADCRIYDFVQQLKQYGVVIGEATLTHYPGTQVEVVDDLVKNERTSGQF